MKLFKKIIYWLTLILPVIDGVKTVATAINDGIEKGREDVRREKERVNCELFSDCMSHSNDGIDAYFGGFYQKDDKR